MSPFVCLEDESVPSAEQTREDLVFALRWCEVIEGEYVGVSIFPWIRGVLEVCLSGG